ncbi:MAG: hypothetical protein KF833_18685 [Verrucomicrobiae bacterium]|nr:hypothetical protein [Verrucomicrobiae bacterium]
MNPIEPSPSGPTSQEILDGGINIHLAPDQAVFVRLVPVRLYTDMLGALGDEARLIAIYTDLPEDRIGNLTPPQWERIVEEGDRLNRDFFARWVARRIARQERVMPGIGEQIRTAVSLAVSQASASPPDGPVANASTNPSPGS